MKMIACFLKCGKIFISFINILANYNIISIFIKTHDSTEILKYKEINCFGCQMLMFYTVIQTKYSNK